MSTTSAAKCKSRYAALGDVGMGCLFESWSVEMGRAGHEETRGRSAGLGEARRTGRGTAGGGGNTRIGLRPDPRGWACVV